MRERVVAEHVAFAQLAQHRFAVRRVDLPADHEERRARVVLREHPHERRRVGIRPVVEADRHLVSVRPVRVDLRAAAAAADDPVTAPFAAAR